MVFAFQCWLMLCCQAFSAIQHRGKVTVSIAVQRSLQISLCAPVMYMLEHAPDEVTTDISLLGKMMLLPC